MNPFDPFSEQEIKQIEEIRAESIGWIPLTQGAYFHASSEAKIDRVIITGLADAGLDTENVLLLI
jgi:hypothetical protein